MGITSLFKIQGRVFDSVLRGRSVVGRSRTGTGKTIAYLLPVLERVRNEKMTAPHSVLVLVPTRELCKQVGGTILSLSVTSSIALVYGGPSLASQEQLVRLGANIVVATPGRCARLLEQGAIERRNVQILVIDEADAMLGLEYIGRVQKVLKAVAKPGLQNVLFSASLPRDVQAVIDQHFQAHELIDLVDRGGVRNVATVDGVVDHRICRVPTAPRGARARVLLHTVSARLDELGGRCIVFVDSPVEAESLLAHPVLDRKARALHNNSSLEDRDVVLSSFANRKFDVLLATDILSRGLDFADVTLVVQYHPPKNATQYLHRAGRTGRAGSKGTCIMLYDESEYPRVQRVQSITKQKLKVDAAPDAADMHHASVSRLLDELLQVQPQDYEPLLGEAEEMLAERGPHALALAMAMLDGRHASLERAAREAPSLLTGRAGFTCLLAHDMEHSAVDSEADLRNLLLDLLPSRAGDAALGRVARTAQGWAFDVRRPWDTVLVEDLRSGRQTAPFEVVVAQRMPRVERSAPFRVRSRRLPWRKPQRELRRRVR